MANELQNSLLTAIDTVIEQRIEDLELDKTVVASIEQIVNANESKYRVQYKGGSMIAYSQSDEVYAPNTSVYVSIPQNDFSKKKWIIGKVTNTNREQGYTETAAALEDYQLVGNNTISLVDKNNTEFGLCSYYGADAKILYTRNQPNENVLQIDETKLKQYLDTSKALLIQATFRTDLDSFQKRKEGADYGLIFNLVFEHGDATYSTMNDKFNALAPQIKISQLQDNFLSLMKCDEDVRSIVYQWENYDKPVITAADAETKLTIISASVKSMLNGFSPEENDLVELYSLLLEEMIKSIKLGGSEWCKIYHEWFAQSTNTLVNKKIIYNFNTDDMVGNPLLFRIASEQYNIFPIDTGRFKYIEDVVFFCEDFEKNPGLTQENDIFVSNIELYGLQELSAVNGDYRLNLSFPQGQIFNNPTVQEDGEVIQPGNLTVDAKLTYKKVEINTSIEYFWFIKDGLVNSAGHPQYHMRGGVGWRHFNNVKDRDLTVSAEANTAYENIYKCVVVYNSETVLKAEFTIYNDANKREIIIDSDLGDTFKFDSGEPVLTCKILDSYMTEETEPVSVPSQYKDTKYGYEYVWMRKDQQGQVLVLDKTYEELKKEYNNSTISQQLLLQSKLAEMENVVIDRNMIQYPAGKIAANSAITFECYVYRTEIGEQDKVYLGCASIVLKNEAAAALNEYYIIIENGDQVFQYTESGVSPCNERFQDPVKPKNLICHLYDPNGLEVNSNNYSVKWEYPIASSLLVPPSDLKINPSTQINQWLYSSEAPVKIAESYDYSALENQIKCIVQYDTIEVTQETKFYFGKIGDNGTNGTDVVAKLEPIVTGDVLDNEPLTLISSLGRSYWNSGLVYSAATSPLELKLFRRTEYIPSAEYKNVKWTMAGGASSSNRFVADKGLEAPQLLTLTNSEEGSKKYSNYIVKGEAKLDKVDGSEGTQTHYAFYPICLIDYAAGVRDLGIAIDKDKTLKHILYNADGRQPQYNVNQGVFFNFSISDPDAYYIHWEAKGGLEKEENLPAFDLFYNEDVVTEDGRTIEANTTVSRIDGCPYVWIKPKDVYGGAAQNNHVKATLYKTEVNKKIEIATVYIPIYMSLNLYGLASLNGWDGNTIEINEDENYIMAPQIGAGIKHEDNTFTGVVMGSATTYGDDKTQIGLLGYSQGRQSIFLDAETGNATFGLPEQDERDPNQKNKNEGRVELRPGGLSSIAKWKFNSRALFNVPDANPENTPDYDTWGGLVDPYEDLKQDNYDLDEEDQYLKSVPHDKSGILLGSRPSYISIKGRPLTEEDNINYTSASAIVKPGDTFELQLDPNQPSLFTIYRHTTTAKNGKMAVKGTGQDIYIGIPLQETGQEGESIVEDLTQYSTPVFEASTGEVCGWTALIPDPDYKEYLVAVKKKLNSSGTKYMWVIKAVAQPGYYSLSWFEDKDNDPSIWRREPRVGIDNQGRFYTNALKNSTSSLVINEVGAFGSEPDSGLWMGASFEVGQTEQDSNSLIKMFTYTGEENAELNNPRGTLHISGSSIKDNEYMRPMRLYGNAITLSADKNASETGEGANHSVHSTNRIKISPDVAFIGWTTDKPKNMDEEVMPVSGDFLLFNKNTDTNKLYSGKTFTTLIAEDSRQSNSSAYVFDHYNFWSLGNYNKTNSITKVESGSIANYAYGGDETRNTTDISYTDSVAGSGNIINYANGSLQLNKVQKNEDNIHYINKALQINNKNILFGNIDSFSAKNYTAEARESWGGTSNTVVGQTYTLTDSISSGFRFEADNNGTTLATKSRFGLYSQNGIDVKDLSGIGISLGSKKEGKETYFWLQSGTNHDIKLYSNKNSCTFESYAAGNSTSTNLKLSNKTDKQGFNINPGFCTGYGIFTDVISTNNGWNEFSVYAEKKVRAEDIRFSSFSWADSYHTWKTYVEQGDNQSNLTYIIVRLYERIKALENAGYITAAALPNMNNYVTKSTYNNHVHNVTLAAGDLGATSVSDSHYHSVPGVVSVFSTLKPRQAG